VIKEKCPDCHGTGYIPMKKRYSVDIPAGIDNGQSTRMPGLGEPGVNGGPRGDVLIEVIVGRHPIFQRQDFDIYSTVPVSFAVAALGGEILIDTVDGKVIYDVKPGTQTDTRIRLRGKGVPSWRNKDTRGDHYVTLVVQVPDKLSHEAKELLRQFDEVTGDTLNATAKSKDAQESSGDTKDGKDSKKKKFWK
jgi:molecular chaperone DnaJ